MLKNGEKSSEKSGAGGNNGKGSKNSVIFYILLFCLLLTFNVMGQQMIQENKVEKKSFNEFMKDLEDGKIDTVYLDKSAGNMRYSLLNEKTKDMTFNERNEIPYTDKEMFITDYPNGSEEFVMDVIKHDVQFAYNEFGAGKISPFIVYVLQLLPSFILLYFMFKVIDKQMNGGAKSALLAEDVTNVKFEDIKGQDEAINDIKQALKIMQLSSESNEMKVRPPKGILLIGPPGTGKTMIAKAMANEAKLKFFYVNSSSIIDRFVGMGAKNIRDTFEEARKNQPCVIFFDEIDAIGGNRNSFMASSSENQQTLNALLQELDGFKPQDKIYLMAATNMYEHLDPALIRSGRFDRKITINPPRDASTRYKLLEQYLGDTIDESVDLGLISRQLAGFTGADIAQIANESKIIAIQNNKSKVSGKHIEEAIDKTLFNGNRTKNEFKDDLKIVAYHESGHALSMLLNNTAVARISIIPNTSGVGGMVVQQDKENLFVTKKDLWNRLKSTYSGRIAEELIFGADNVTNGASNDIVQARKILEGYIQDFAFDSIDSLVEDTEEDAVKKKASLANRVYDEARQELLEHIDVLKNIAKVVLKAETMDGSDLKELFNQLMECEDADKMSDVSDNWIKTIEVEEKHAEEKEKQENIA